MVMLDMTVLCWPARIHQPQELSAALKDKIRYDTSLLSNETLDNCLLLAEYQR